MNDWTKSSERCKSVIDEINNQRMEEKANFKKSVNEKFEKIEERLDKIEKRLDDNESSMKHMNQKLDMILSLLQKKEEPGKKIFSCQDFNLEGDDVSLGKRNSP